MWYQFFFRSKQYMVHRKCFIWSWTSDKMTKSVLTLIITVSTYPFSLIHLFICFLPELVCPAECFTVSIQKRVLHSVHSLSTVHKGLQWASKASQYFTFFIFLPYCTLLHHEAVLSNRSKVIQLIKLLGRIF